MTPLPTYYRREESGPFNHLINECDNINCEKCMDHEMTHQISGLPSKKQNYSLKW